MRAVAEYLRPEIYLDFHSSGQEVLRTYAPCANETTTAYNLIERYLDIVKYTAERMHMRLPAEVDVEDLMSAGLFGLMDAIDAFDLEHVSVGAIRDGRLGQASELLQRDWALWRIARRFRPDIVLTRNPAGVQVARFCGALGRSFRGSSAATASISAVVTGRIGSAGMLGC